MTLLALDLSSHTGYAVFKDGKLTDYGSFKVIIEDFNVNKDPNKSDKYPKNLIAAAHDISSRVRSLIEQFQVTEIVVENTTKGRNRHTQRLLEFIHFQVLQLINFTLMIPLTYMDPSEWRKILDQRLSKEDKKNNSLVSKGKKRGRIGKKHLSVRFVNDTFNLSLKMKHNNEADAICLGLAYLKSREKK